MIGAQPWEFRLVLETNATSSRPSMVITAITVKSQMVCQAFYVNYGTRSYCTVGEDFAVPINDAPVKFSTVFKYLGVKLDDSISYSEHVRYAATKVSQKLGLMSRIRHLQLTSESANRLYKAMILPLLEYCDVTWHGCGKENSLKIERMQ